MSEFDLKTVLDAAAKHGEVSGADHEIGDLQDAFRVAYGLLPDVTKEKFWDSSEVQNVIDCGWYEDDHPREAESIITAAKQHGEDSEPDHEAGDLIDALTQAWELMPVEARAKFQQDETIQRNIATAEVDLDSPGLSGR